MPPYLFPYLFYILWLGNTYSRMVGCCKDFKVKVKSSIIIEWLVPGYEMYTVTILTIQHCLLQSVLLSWPIKTKQIKFAKPACLDVCISCKTQPSFRSLTKLHWYLHWKHHCNVMHTHTLRVITTNLTVFSTYQPMLT